MTFVKLTQETKTTMPENPKQLLTRNAWFAPARSINALITPIDDRGLWGRSYVVQVRDYNERSISFQHMQPLNERRAIVVLECKQTGRITAEVDLTWCRFHRAGGYTSGGRFVQRMKKIA